ncbi:preprotein translocase subunit SecD [Sphingobacterium sp. SRCM116780]|uniref:preprotein translocase subunit SecD n=1 Tax=Sphingobacterium sp. SRCM116780 TaxID=2907623 RepID=UPI001F395738|nr:preprotein translocase subunit SecD [Sphingobacterium sp. SRCM116780]UIR54913.1 preprotein translocase subunit SecD [Sphingobacterium sp. SRCM116780]
MGRIILVVAMLFSITTSAQQMNKDPRYKQYTGRYGGNSGVCLFDDGKFMLYGYATMVFGSYGFEKDYLVFFPEEQELFQVFAHHNNTLGDSTKINFVGFDRGGKTFVQFDKDTVYRVFNEHANCFNGPFVYMKNAIPQTFRLANALGDLIWYNREPENSWYYTNDKGYNDFILIYNKPRREYQNFFGSISTTENITVLKLSNYGGEGGYPKQKMNKDDKEQWEKAREWKNEYYHSDSIQENVIFANKHYNTFLPDSADYTYEKSSNQYINKQALENEGYFRNNQYDDDRYLRKYVKLLPKIKDTTGFSKNEITNSSIFFTACDEGSKKSYHYEGIENSEEESAVPQTVIGMSEKK